MSDQDAKDYKEQLDAYMNLRKNADGQAGQKVEPVVWRFMVDGQWFTGSTREACQKVLDVAGVITEIQPLYAAPSREGHAAGIPDVGSREFWMERWDEWRAYISSGGKGSMPRDSFESLLDAVEELKDYCRKLSAESAPTAVPDCSAPDKGALKEQSDAWFAVCAVLSEIDPDWITRAKCGMDAAVLAVKALANKAKDSLKPVPCEKCGMDLVLGCQVCAAGWPSKLSDIEQARRDALKPDEALIEEIADAARSRWIKDALMLFKPAAELAIREYIRRSAGKEKG